MIADHKMVRITGLVAALLLSFCLGGGATIWASSLARPERQTVPLTPPATWTPNVPRPTQPPAATRKPRPTQGATPRSFPFLELSASPVVLSPQADLDIVLTCENVGNAPLTDATVVLTSPGVTDRRQLKISTGSISLPQEKIVWQVANLAPDQIATLNLTGVIRRDILPDRQIRLVAEVRWEGGQELSNQVILTLPSAILPATGE